MGHGEVMGLDGILVSGAVRAVTEPGPLGGRVLLGVLVPCCCVSDLNVSYMTSQRD